MRYIIRCRVDKARIAASELHLKVVFYTTDGVVLDVYDNVLESKEDQIRKFVEMVSRGRNKVRKLI